MYTHIKFVRPSTGSELVIQPPCGPFNQNLFMENQEVMKWTIEEYPDWIPMEFLGTEEAREYCGEDV